MKTHGQVSLELLLITAAFLSVLALMVPLFQTIFSGGLFGIEALKTKAFADSFQQKTRLLNVLGANSQLILRIEPSIQWRILIQENQLLVEIDGKVFERELSLVALPTEITISESTQLFLQKENGFLVVHR